MYVIMGVDALQSLLGSGPKLQAVAAVLAKDTSAIVTLASTLSFLCACTCNTDIKFWHVVLQSCLLQDCAFSPAPVRLSMSSRMLRTPYIRTQQFSVYV